MCLLGCMVVWGLAPLPHSKRVPGLNLSVWSLHVLSVYTWVHAVLSGYSSFLPPPKNMHVRFTGNSKLSLGANVSVDGCVSRLSLCGPVMDWRPVQDVPCLLPSWDRLQHPKLDEAGVENGWGPASPG